MVAAISVGRKISAPVRTRLVSPCMSVKLRGYCTERRASWFGIASCWQRISCQYVKNSMNQVDEIAGVIDSATIPSSKSTCACLLSLSLSEQQIREEKDGANTRTRTRTRSELYFTRRFLKQTSGRRVEWPVGCSGFYLRGDGAMVSRAVEHVQPFFSLG